MFVQSWRKQTSFSIVLLVLLFILAPTMSIDRAHALRDLPLHPIKTHDRHINKSNNNNNNSTPAQITSTTSTPHKRRQPPSTNPFGFRLAYSNPILTPHFASQDSNSLQHSTLSVTWSTSLPLTHTPPCCQFTTSIDTKKKDSSNAASPLYANTALHCGTTRRFVEPSVQTSTSYIHTVIYQIPSTTNTTTIHYRCGSDQDGWSPTRTMAFPLPYTSTVPNSQEPPFFTMDQKVDTTTSDKTAMSHRLSTKLLLVGDLGVLHAVTLPRLLSDATTGQYSALLHIGDLAYDLDGLEGRRGQQFLHTMEPITSILPYMTTPGNHEATHQSNFSHYRSLYEMPSSQMYDNLYYSYNVGQVHVLSYNTEVFFWPQYYNESHMERMYSFMNEDLQGVDRTATPWVVVIGHRPMYCAKASSSPGVDGRRCGWEQEASRRGIPSYCVKNNPRTCRYLDSSFNNNSNNNNSNNDDDFRRNYYSWPIEDLLHKYNVDVAVYGHIHDYERYASVYNYTISDSSSSSIDSGQDVIYKNPPYTIHITSGAGGNSEMQIGPGLPPQGSCIAPCIFQSGYGPDTQYQGYDFSYSRIVAENATHFYWEQVSATFEKVIDRWWIVREM